MIKKYQKSKELKTPGKETRGSALMPCKNLLQRAHLHPHWTRCQTILPWIHASRMHWTHAYWHWKGPRKIDYGEPASGNKMHLDLHRVRRHWTTLTRTALCLCLHVVWPPQAHTTRHTAMAGKTAWVTERHGRNHVKDSQEPKAANENFWGVYKMQCIWKKYCTSWDLT